MPTQKIAVSATDHGPTDPWAPQYDYSEDEKKMTPVGDVMSGAEIKSPNIWMSTGHGGKPVDIRMTGKQAALAEQVARSWRENDDSWSGFTQNTTFHGIKYIFESGAKYKWRR